MASLGENWDFESSRAEQIIKGAETLIKKGRIKKGIAAFDNAIQIYLDNGDYAKVAEIFINLTHLLYTQKDSIVLILNKIERILLSVEKFDIPEEEAKLKMVLADLYYNITDYQQAGQLYQEVAELYIKDDPEENYRLAAVFFLKASECFQKVDKIEKAENLILKAVMEVKKTNFDLQAKDQMLFNLIKSKKFEQSIEIIREIALFFRESNEEIEKIKEDFQDTPIMEALITNVNAWLILHVCEYNLLKTVCYKETQQIDNMVHQTEKSIKDMLDAISLIKDNIVNLNIYSFEDLKILSIHMFLIQLFQEISDTQIEDPITIVERGLDIDVVEKFRKLLFYRLTKELVDNGISDNMKVLKGINIGRLTPFWDILEKSILG